MTEPPEVEARFREATPRGLASPKVWAEAWLLATAQGAGGVLVTFDRALGAKGAVWLGDSGKLV